MRMVAAYTLLLEADVHLTMFVSVLCVLGGSATAAFIVKVIMWVASRAECSHPPDAVETAPLLAKDETTQDLSESAAAPTSILAPIFMINLPIVLGG